MGVPLFKELHRAYGFDDVAIVPGEVTINPDMTKTEFSIGDHLFNLPVLASAMDAVVSPSFANLMSDMGGLAVLNLEGIHTRYEDPYSVLEKIVAAPQAEATGLLQRVYSEPVKEELIGKCVHQVKKSGAVCAGSFTPQNTKRLSPLAVEAGADIHSRAVHCHHCSAHVPQLSRLDLLRATAYA